MIILDDKIDYQKLQEECQRLLELQKQLVSFLAEKNLILIDPLEKCKTQIEHWHAQRTTEAQQRTLSELAEKLNDQEKYIQLMLQESQHQFVALLSKGHKYAKSGKITNESVDFIAGVQQMYNRKFDDNRIKKAFAFGHLKRIIVQMDGEFERSLNHSSVGPQMRGVQHPPKKKEEPKPTESAQVQQEITDTSVPATAG